MLESNSILDYSYINQSLNNSRSRKLCDVTFFSVAWSPPIKKNGGVGSNRYLASCSDAGDIYYCAIDATNELCSDAVEGSGNLMPNHQDCSIFRQEITESILYHLKFFKASNKWFMSVCGDHGISIYLWEDIVAKLSQTQTKKSMNNVQIIENIKPISQYKAYPSISIRSPALGNNSSNNNILCSNTPEINYTAVDESRNVIYGASGDLFGCYQWDLESGKLLSTLSSASSSKGSKNHHEDYLHAICAVPGSSGQVLTAGEDGKVGWWDAKQNKVVEMISCREVIPEYLKQPLLGKNSHFWVSGITPDRGSVPNIMDGGEITTNWACFCGGIEKNVQNQRNNNENEGFLAMWNLPTRTITSAHTTKENIQSVEFFNDRIVTIGNENVVTYWSAYARQKYQDRVWCTPSSCFGIGVDDFELSSSNNSSSRRFAVCGKGNMIDCFSDTGHRSFGVSLQ